LYGYRTEHLTHTPQRRADGFVSSLLWPRLYLTDLGHGLNDRVAFACEEVLRKCVQYVHTVDQVTLTYRYVHGYDLVLIWLVDLKRRLQDVQEVGQLVVPDIPGSIWVKVLPYLVVHVVVIVRQALLHVLSGLRIVLQNHRDIHVYHDQEIDHQVRKQKRRAHSGAATAARNSHLQVWLYAVLLIRYTVQNRVPSG